MMFLNATTVKNDNARVFGLQALTRHLFIPPYKIVAPLVDVLAWMKTMAVAVEMNDAIAHIVFMTIDNILIAIDNIMMVIASIFTAIDKVSTAVGGTNMAI